MNFGDSNFGGSQDSEQQSVSVGLEKFQNWYLEFLFYYDCWNVIRDNNRKFDHSSFTKDEKKIYDFIKCHENYRIGYIIEMPMPSDHSLSTSDPLFILLKIRNLLFALAERIFDLEREDYFSKNKRLSNLIKSFMIEKFYTKRLREKQTSYELDQANRWAKHFNLNKNIILIYKLMDDWLDLKGFSPLSRKIKMLCKSIELNIVVADKITH